VEVAVPVLCHKRIQGGLTRGISDTGSWVGGLLGPFFSWMLNFFIVLGVFMGFWGTDKSIISQIDVLYCTNLQSTHSPLLEHEN
jgi:hypothetical protein